MYIIRHLWQPREDIPVYQLHAKSLFLFLDSILGRENSLLDQFFFHCMMYF